MKVKKCIFSKKILVAATAMLLIIAAFCVVSGWEIQRQKQVQVQKQQELAEAGEMYNSASIVLADTSPEQAQSLAELLEARLRITEDGGYAVLYLPEGLRVEDVYNSEEYRPYLSAMSLDYYVAAEDVSSGIREPVVGRPTFVVTDEAYPQQNYLDYLNLRDTWSFTRGAGITVAVIDSGIDTDHPDFAGKISSRSYDVSNDRVVADYDLSVIEDTDGHGTTVAGVIAAGMNDGVGITGIAPEVELIVIKCETDGQGNFLRSSDLVFGLAYAIECDADVVNMSFSLGVNVFEKYTRLAVDSDIICVAAAGNESSPLPCYPAADENVIGVGALDMNTWSLADYSNYGFSLVLAPGTAYTTAVGGGYRSATGTSIASPIVTSAVALYLSANPYTEFDVMCELLKASSADLGIPGEDRQHGFGALDIHALVLEEKGTITYEMLTDELKPQTQIFVKGHTIQYMPEPERENVVLDGWYYDMECTDEVAYYETVFSQDVTLYAAWINEDEGTVYTYTTMEDGTVEIHSYTGRRRYLTIPAVLEGKTVSSIGENAFKNNTRLRSVKLPESLRYIGDGAFSGCANIREIEIPDSVVRIGNRAFYDCVSMGYVSLMKNGELTAIGDLAFGMCGINTIHLPCNLQTLGTGVFYGSTGMTSVTVEAGNTAYQVRNKALYDAAGTTIIYYPAGLSGSYTLESNTLNVAEYAFAYSRSDVVLNEGLQVLGMSAFENSYVSSATLPASVVELGSYCYAYSRLSEIRFGEGSVLNQIPDSAFAGCSYLKSATIPACITQIGNRAFCWSGLRSISFAEGSRLQTIGPGAFAYSAITKIVLPASLEDIGSQAFCNCQSLMELTWEQGSVLKQIGSDSFANCTALKQFEMPESLREVGALAFFGSGLEKLTISANLTALGDGAFSGCQNLTGIQVESGNSAYTAVDGVVFTADKKLLCIFPAGRSGTYTVPETVTRIGNYAFADAKMMTSVTLGEGLEEISGYAFSGCSALNTPVLPASLTTIGENAFEYCSSMNGSLTVPKNVISIGRFAFYQDFDLTQIVIEPESKLPRIGYGAFGYCGITDFTVPRNVSSMGQEVFVGCRNLLTVTFEADSQLTAIAAWSFSGADELRQITFEEGSNLKLLEARSLEGLRKLERVTLENCTQLTTIDNYAFQNCVSLTEITLPESLTEIGRYAFNGCRSLSRIDLPESISFIGRYAFNRTNNLNVYFRASVLPLHLQENWDHGIAGYYVSTVQVITSGNWQYALTGDGKASIVAYTGAETDIVLTTLDGHEIISIGGYAFADNTTLESIVLPDTLQGVYRYAFKGTTALKSITIPAAVAIIDTGAFQGSGLSSLTFAGDSALVSLGRYAFADTANLTAITLPEGVKAIHDYTFRNSSIRNIDFGENPALTEIGRYAFQGAKLQSVEIPAGVTRIDYDAFRGCSDLTQVDLGKAPKLQIYGSAFYGSGLTEITIPAGVEYIGEFCFASCPNLTSITVDEANEKYISLEGVLYNKALTKLITCPAGLTGSYTVPSTVTTLGFAAFEGSRLSKVIFPEDSTLVTLGYRVFYNCDNLTAITIPAGVQSIDNYAFAECGNLASVTIPAESQLSGIYKSAFYNCTALTGITIPAGVQEIGDYAFYGCSSLTDLEFAENCQIKGIYDHAFANSGVTEFTMPDGLLDIGTSAFQSSKLDTLVCNDTVITIGDFAFADCGLANTTVLEFPATVENMGHGALQHATGIENLTLPFLGTTEKGNNVFMQDLFGENPVTLKAVRILRGEVIPIQVFAGCANLESAVLPPETRVIGYYAFAGTALKSIELPETVMEIHSHAFDRTNLSEVKLPDSLTILYEGAFYDTQIKEIYIPAALKYMNGNPFSELERIVVDENNQYFTVVDGILYTSDMQTLVCASSLLTGEIVIPDTVNTMSERSFYACKNITSVQLPAGITILPSYCFNDCTSLKTIEIPSSVTDIKNSCFRGCTNLESVTMHSGLKVLDHYAFSDCHSLKTVELPDTLTIMYGNVFAFCYSLKTVELPDALTTIGDANFYHCSSLETITLPKNLEYIDTTAFEGCSALQEVNVDEENKTFFSRDGIVYNRAEQSVIFVPCAVKGHITIPEGITTLGDSVFIDREGLESVTLPDSLTEIGRTCFAGCINLKRIELGSNIHSIGASAFLETAIYNDSNRWVDGMLYIDDYLIKAELDTISEQPSIREGTRLIAEDCFAHCSQIRRIVLPESLEYLGWSAFSGCTNLHSIWFGSQIRDVGAYAFYGCQSLKCLDIRNATSAFQDSFPFVNVTTLEYLLYEGEEGGFQDHGSGLLRSRCPLKTVLVSDNMFRIGHFLGDTPNKIILQPTDYVNGDLFLGLREDTKIYCYADEESSSTWEEGWNYGMKVYYADEWNQITFYVDCFTIAVDAFARDEIVQAPVYTYISAHLLDGTEFLGWDINGDGLVDEIPVTLTEDLEAHAVLRIPVTEIILSETETTMEITDEKPLTVSYNPSYFNTSGQLVWSSSDETIATVDENGRITALTEGQAVITATLAENGRVSASCTVTVIPMQPGIRLKEVEGSLNVGESLTLEPQYVGLEELMDTLTFSSSDETVASVDATGTIIAVAPGTAQITISCGEYSAVYIVNVLLPTEKITITAESDAINVGETQTLTVQFTPEHTTDDRSVTWFSSDSTIAQVDHSGIVTAIAPGTVTITATTRNGLTAEYTMTVYAPIQWIVLNTTTGTIRLDRTKQLEVIYEPGNTTDDKTVTWSTSNPEVATVSDTGLVTGVKAGNAVITGTVGTHSATYTVTVVGLKDAPTGIIVTNSDDTPMEEDVSLVVDPVDNEELDSAYEGITDRIGDEMTSQMDTEVVVSAYDITLQQNGESVQPDTTVDVEIPVAQDLDTESLQVFRVEEDGSLTDMTAKYLDQNMSFNTEHFSLYILCGQKKPCENHAFGDWLVSVEASCTESGEEFRKCGHCGFRETRHVAPKGHSYAHGVCTGCGEADPDFVLTVIGSGWSGDTTWVLTSDGLLTFSGQGAMKNYTYKSQMPWYPLMDQITDVVIEEGVTRIGSYAFYGMAIETIEIPQTVTIIGEYAFKGAEKLEAVELPEGLTRSGEAAFYGCSALKEIHIPDSVYTIFDYTFKNCTALEDVWLSKILIKVGQGAFENCTSLDYIYIPGNVEIIGSWSFKGCTGLVEADMTWADATEIREGAFKNCSALTTIHLPTNIQILGDSCFYGIGATSFTVPATVTKVDPWCFARAYSLKTIIFQGNAPAIGEGAFNKITLTAYYPGDDTTWTAVIMQNYGGTVAWKAN